MIQGRFPERNCDFVIYHKNSSKKLNIPIIFGTIY